MDSDGVDLERMLAGPRGRVLDDGEHVTNVRQVGGPEAWISTDKRELDVYRPDWRVLRAPWVADAVLVAWEQSSPSHYEDQVYGLILGRDGRDHLLSWEEDDLADLGRRLAVEGGPEAIDPAAYAELLAFFHTAPYLRGHLIDDPARAGDRSPDLAGVPGLHPIRTRLDDGQVTVEFQAYQRYPGSGPDRVVIREWAVRATARGPATWTEHEVATLAG